MKKRYTLGLGLVSLLAISSLLSYIAYSIGYDNATRKILKTPLGSIAHAKVQFAITGNVQFPKIFSTYIIYNENESGEKIPIYFNMDGKLRDATKSWGALGVYDPNGERIENGYQVIFPNLTTDPEMIESVVINLKYQRKVETKN